MKTSLKIIFILLAVYFLLSLMGCASGPYTTHYSTSVHYSTGWGYYDRYPPPYRPPHYRPPPPHRPPPGHRPPGRPPGGRPPGGGPKPTPMPSRR